MPMRRRPSVARGRRHERFGRAARQLRDLGRDLLQRVPLGDGEAVEGRRGARLQRLDDRSERLVRPQRVLARFQAARRVQLQVDLENTGAADHALLVQDRRD